MIWSLVLLDFSENINDHSTFSFAFFKPADTFHLKKKKYVRQRVPLIVTLFKWCLYLQFPSPVFSHSSSHFDFNLLQTITPLKLFSSYSHVGNAKTPSTFH